MLENKINTQNVTGRDAKSIKFIHTNISSSKRVKESCH